MAKPRKLKVFAAEIDGLHDWIVAAPNRPDALAAFGVRQDLFAQGLAGEEQAPDKVEAALAMAGTPLRRLKGTTGKFAPASGAADWSAAAPKGGGTVKAKAPKPDRRALDAAEATLRSLDAHHRRVLDDIEADRVRLGEREAAEAKAYRADRANAQAARDRAAKAQGG